MEETQLMQEGLSLMAFGMGFVFVFLTLLVIATTLMSKLVMRFAPAPVKEGASTRAAPPARAQDDDVMAVISAAVHHYRQRHRR